MVASLDSELQIADVTRVEIVAPYTLRITFEDGAERTINFESVLQGYYFEPLRDLKLFDQVRVDPEVQTLVWPNGADFDPATLYNWNQGDGAELIEKTKQWEQQNQIRTVAQ